MASQDCIDAVKRAIDTDDEDLITEVFERVEKEVKRDRIAREGELAEDRLKRLGRTLATEEVRAAQIAKRNAAINLRKRLEAVQFVKSQFQGNYTEGLKALLGGTSLARAGGRNSVEAAQMTLKRRYSQGFLTDVESAGHWKLFVSGHLDKDIARALSQIDRPQPNLKGLRDEAIEIARIMRRYQEGLRREANKAGADIRMRDDFIVSQNHDMYKIRKAGEQQWIDDISPLLDESTFDGVDDIPKFMKNVYQNLATGVHLSNSGGGVPSGFKGGSNLAKRMSEGRLLHFKEDGWINYNEKYGNGELREIFLHGIDSMANNIGIMRVLGTNPENNLKQIVQELAADLNKAGDIKAIETFNDTTKENGSVMNLFREVDGSINIPGKFNLARWTAFARSLQSLTKLGGVTLSAFPDTGYVGSELHFQGTPFLKGYSAPFKRLLGGKLSKEKKEIAKSLGIFSDAMAGAATSRFQGGADDLPGKMTSVMTTFFKYNGLTWWTDRSREAFGLTMSSNMALHTGKKLDNLPGQLGNLLRGYGIDDEIWDMFRKVKTPTAEGEAFVVPEMARDIADADVIAYLKARNLDSRPKAIERFKEDIEDKFATSFVDRAQTAVIEPGARTNATLNQGLGKGTPLGEVLRLVTQFKSFPVAVLQKPISREIYGRGSDTLSQALRNGNGEMVGLAQLILATTALGYLSMSAKDIAKNREPRVPDDPKEFGKIFVASMLQGGALGVYGDFLFGELKTGYGTSAISSLLGPTASTADQVFDLLGRVTQGDDAAAQTLSLVTNNTPFLNVFYVRGALDALIIDRAREAVNPGHKRRMEERLKRENDQELLF